MKLFKLQDVRRFLPASLALIPVAVFGQSVSDNPSDSAEEDEEVFTLSPFTVTAEENSGYLGSKTLAGNRLNTNVSDLGASISVYTKELMDDLGATNSSDLLVYTAGTEAGGPGGNFSGATTSINAAEVDGNGPRQNPQSSRTRGLAQPNFTRNFFMTDVPFDSYIVDSVTVSRGPNAILFGVGSPAGVVDNTTVVADPLKERAKVSFRIGDNDSFRSSLDYNHVLIEDKLAVRFAVLADREKYDQNPAFEDKDRLYGAINWRPSDSNSLKANFETGKSYSNRPISVLPFMSVTEEWLADPDLYDFTEWDTDPAIDGSSVDARGPFVSNGRIYSSVIGIYDSPDASEKSLLSFNSSITGGGEGQYLLNDVYHPLFNQDSASDNYQFWSTVNLGDTQIDSSYWSAERLASLGITGVPEGQVPPGTRYQGFTDDSVFDWRGQMIDETSRQGYEFDTYSISFEQRAWEDKIGIELAYDFQNYDRDTKNSFFSFSNGNHISIDPNVYLPIEDPNNPGQLMLNPNLGRPFTTYGQGPWNYYSTERETLRGTGYLRYDFRDMNEGLGRWLGSHTLTGLVQSNRSDVLNYTTRLAGVGPSAEAINSSLNNGSRRATTLVYLGDSILNTGGEIVLNPIQVPEIVAGSQPGAWYFTRELGDTMMQGDLELSPYSMVEILNNGSAQRELIESNALILQSRFLDNHLVTMAGWREDKDFVESYSLKFVEDPADPNNPGQVHYGLNDFDFASKGDLLAEKQTWSYSAVLKAPKSITDRLPGNTEFSLFYNESENFTPLGKRTNPFTGAIIDPPTGSTKEYGFNLFTFKDKLSLRANWFETAVSNIDATSTDYIVATQNGVVLIADFWVNHANTQPENTDFYFAAVDHIFSGFPEMRELYNFQINEEVVNGVTKYDATWSVPGNRADVTDFEAEGFELEMTWNPTKNLRILANVAKQETIQVESSKLFQEFMNGMLPIWDDLWNVPRNGAYPTGMGPGDDVLPQFTGERSLPAWDGTGRQTLGTWITNRILTRYSTYKSTDGTASAEQRKWRANLVINYDLGSGSIFGDKLEGWSVGTGIRWQDKIGVGYPTSFDETADVADRVQIHVDQPYFAPDQTNIDFKLGYKRKIFNDSVDWKMQLNVRNAIASDDFITVVAQPWGDDAIVRIPPEQRWYLTNTFSF